MNLLLFGFVLILFSFNATYTVDNTLQFFDILPDFAGYLLIWFLLEKRRINKPLKHLYTGIAAMTLVSFLFFLGQIKIFFVNLLDGDLIFLNGILDGLTYVLALYGGGVLLVAVLMLGWFLFGMLKYWNQTEGHKLQRTVCKGGMALCGLSGACHISTLFLDFSNLAFHPNWIAYPLSALALAAAWFVTKDCQEMLTGSREPVDEYRFGVKKGKKK